MKAMINNAIHRIKNVILLIKIKYHRKIMQTFPKAPFSKLLFKVKEQEQSKRLAVLHRCKFLKFAALSWLHWHGKFSINHTW